MFAAILRAFIPLPMGCVLAARKKRQGQNHLAGLIPYEHHQSQIILVVALFRNALIAHSA